MHATMPVLKPRQLRRSRRKVRVGPEHDGRRMPLRLFARAEAAPGYRYELAKGVVQVTDIPGMPHNFVVFKLGRMLVMYDAEHPGIIKYTGGAGEAKMEMWAGQTERHPDFSIYLTDPPSGVDQPWDQWVPAIAVEVVSASSAKRDYEEKSRDYLAAGVLEYWILDPGKRTGVFLLRHVDSWLEHRLVAKGKWKTPRLPGFNLDLAKVFGRAPNRK